jgi:hypothetical protein
MNLLSVLSSAIHLVLNSSYSLVHEVLQGVASSAASDMYGNTGVPLYFCLLWTPLVGQSAASSRTNAQDLQGGLFTSWSGCCSAIRQTLD